MFLLLLTFTAVMLAVKLGLINYEFRVRQPWIDFIFANYTLTISIERVPYAYLAINFKQVCKLPWIRPVTTQEDEP